MSALQSPLCENISTLNSTLILPFNGSHLGKYEFSSIITWCYPCNPMTRGRRTVVLYAILRLDNYDHHVVLKRNCTGNDDQIIVDELKHLFGLTKMGTHQIRLHGIPKKYNTDFPWILDNGQLNYYIHPQWSDYFVFKANTAVINNSISFISMTTLKDTVWLPGTGSEINHNHRAFYYELQKIFAFRDLFKIDDTSLTNVLIKIDLIQKRGIPLSIDEMNMKFLGDTYRKLPHEIEHFFFSKTTTKTEILVKMLGLTREKYMEQIEILRHSISIIIARICEDKLWIVNEIIEQLVNQSSMYFNIIHGDS